MTAPTITAMPPVPGASGTFLSDDADDYLAVIPALIDEANAQAQYRAIHDPIVEMDGLAASGESTIAEWVSGTTYSRGSVVWSPITYLDYVRLIAGAGTTDPSADPTNWQLVTGAGDATLTGAQTWTNKTFKSPIIQGTVRETVYTITDGGSVDINPANGSIQLWQLFDDRSPTAASFANGQAIVLMLNNPAGFTITWPTVTWFNGVSPIHHSSKYSIIVLSKRGGTLYGKFIGSAGSVSPLALFDAGEQGAFFLPHPKTCFTDTARTTPAAVGDTVAGMTDLSGRGNHATQSTAASRPILACHPAVGRRTLLTYTEAHSNPAWIKSNCAVSTNTDVVNPDGSASVSTVTATSAGAYFYQAVGIGVGVQGVASLWIRRRTGTGNIRLRASITTDTIITVTSSWTRVEMPTVGYAGNSWVLNIETSGDAVDIWHPQLEIKPDGIATAYQKVVSTYEITEDGVGTLYHLVFDGTDDFLATGSIDFSGSDKVTVWAGVRKDSDAASGTVAELSADFGSNSGAFLLRAPQGAAATYGLFARGSVSGTGATTATSYAAPVTNILCGQVDIAADSTTLRVNGASAATDSSNLGTGNFGNYPLYICRRGGSSLPYTGNLYGLIVRGGTAAAEKLTSTETWLNAKTGAY